MKRIEIIKSMNSQELTRWLYENTMLSYDLQMEICQKKEKCNALCKECLMKYLEEDIDFE